MAVAEPLEWRPVRDTLLWRRRRSEYSWAFSITESGSSIYQSAPEMLFFAREVWSIAVGGTMRARPDRPARSRVAHPARALRGSAARAQRSERAGRSSPEDSVSPIEGGHCFGIEGSSGGGGRNA